MKINVVQSVSKTTEVKISPIIINEKLANFQTLIYQVRQTLGHNNFLGTHGQQHRIYAKTIADQNKILNDLASNNVSHPTFARGDQRLRKVVMKAVSGMDKDQFVREMKD